MSHLQKINWQFLTVIPIIAADLDQYEVTISFYSNLFILNLCLEAGAEPFDVGLVQFTLFLTIVKKRFTFINNNVNFVTWTRSSLWAFPWSSRFILRIFFSFWKKICYIVFRLVTFYMIRISEDQGFLITRCLYLPLNILVILALALVWNFLTDKCKITVECTYVTNLQKYRT
jgi:hypothetical protein